MEPRILLINGPPRSGKDTFAGLLARNFPERRPKTLKFAGWLKRAAHRLFSYPDLLDTEDYKDTPGHRSAPLPGPQTEDVTWRQAYIALSEGLMKPLFGPDIFGRILTRAVNEAILEHNYGLILVSDSGFAAEAESLIAAFPGQVRLVRLHREGHDFAGDSRGYIELPVPSLDIYANDLITLGLEATSSELKELLA